MKRYIKSNNPVYEFYVDDIYENYDYFNVELGSKTIPDFYADVSVSISEHGGFDDLDCDFDNIGDLSDAEFDEIIEDSYEDIEDVILDYLYEHNLVYMDSHGYTRMIYK